MSYSEPLINQPRVLFFSIGVGVLLCFFYILVQGLARLFGEGRFSYYIADGLFCVIFALISFFFMVLYNNGRVRLHLILGEGAGFFLFYFSAGKYLYALFEKGIKLFRKALLIFFKPYAIVFASFLGGMRDLKQNFGRKVHSLKEKDKSEAESEQKKKKKINIFGKIHLKNPDKSV